MPPPSTTTMRVTRPALLLMVLATVLAATLFQAVPRAEAALPPPATLTQTFSGTLLAKIGQTNQGTTRPVTVTVKSVEALGSQGGFNGNITEIKVVSTSNTLGNGDVEINTTTAGWTRTPGSTSRFVLNTPSETAGRVYINGAWRQLKKTTGKDTVTATFAEDGGKLRLLITGQAANGVGTTVIAVEISNLTTGLDAAPLVVSRSPIAGQAASTSVKPAFGFSEPVNTTSAAFTLTCNNTPVAFTISGSGTKTVSLNPTAILQEGATCVATVNAALVTDVDTNDGPNAGAGSESFTFTTDTRPIVVSYSPTLDGSSPVDVNPTVTFSEPVTLAAGAITMECGEGTVIPVIVTMNPARTVATVNPIPTLLDFTTCVVKVYAAKVSDGDTADEPDKPLADLQFSFETDRAPFVQNIEAEPLDPGVVLNTVTSVVSHFPITEEMETDRRIGISFTEPVTTDTGAVAITCNGIPHAIEYNWEDEILVVESINGWPIGAYCSGTVFATKVHDTDSVDPFDTMQQNATFSFKIDSAPYVVSGSPVQNGGYYPGSPITVTFSEPVLLTSFEAASLVCFGHDVPLSSPSTTDNLTITFEPMDSAVLDDIHGGIEGPAFCVFTVFGDEVSDVDHIDAPDEMLSNYVSTMLIEMAPYVLQINISPLEGDVAGPNPTFVVTFSENVTITDPSHAFSLVCDGDPYSLSGGAISNKTSATLSASSIGGPTCTFTVHAEYVSDTDTIDPPDHMDSDSSRDFSTDQAPYIVSTLPADNAVVHDNSNLEGEWGIILGWSEPVAIAEGGVTLVCGPSNTVITTSEQVLGEDSDTGEYGIAVNTGTDLSQYQGSTCTFTIEGDDVSDVDAADPPDHSTDYSYTFTIDSAPYVTKIEAVDGSNVVQWELGDSIPYAGFIPNWMLKVTFSEAVDIGASAFSLVCDSDTVEIDAVNSTAGAYTDVTSVVVDPYDADLAAPGVTDCTFTVESDDVTDHDSADAPDKMPEDQDISFTMERAPEVSEQPTASATGEVTVYFTEAVDFASSPDPVSLVCDSVTIETTVTGSGTAVVTITPDSALPDGAECTLTVQKEGVTDADSIDPSTFDEIAEDIEVLFATDAAPAVVLENSTPNAQDAQIGDSDTIEIVFSEAVTLSSGAITVTCNSVAHSVTVTEGASSDTFEVTSDSSSWGGNGILCTLTVNKDLVADTDLVDPPDNMAADFVLDFEIYIFDAAPAVVLESSIPNAQLADVGASNTIEIVFSEDVTLSPGAITVTCDAENDSDGDPVAVTFAAGASNSTWVVTATTTPWDIDNAPCTLTVDKDLVSDDDLIDSPDIMAEDFVLVFLVDNPDDAPFVVLESSTPSTQNANLGDSDTIEIVFNEAVTLATGAITATCDTAGNEDFVNVPVSFVVGIDNTTWIASADTSPWAVGGSSCVLVVLMNSVTDDDLNDGPDTMIENFEFHFTVGGAPAPVFQSSTPADGAFLIADTDNVTIDVEFDINIAWVGSTVTMNCSVSGSATLVATVSGTTLTIAPAAAATYPSLGLAGACSITINAADVVNASATSVSMAGDVTLTVTPEYA